MSSISEGQEYNKQRQIKKESFIPDEANLSCCSTVSAMLKKNHEQIEDLPKCWTLTEVSLTMMVTHFPCDICFRLITEDFLVSIGNSTLPEVNVTKSLILRIANLPSIDLLDLVVLRRIANNYFERVFGIFIKLEAIQVIYELPNVLQPKEKLAAEQGDDRLWAEVRAERITCDKVTSEKVSRLNYRKHLDSLQERFCNTIRHIKLN